jgi:hypothetical protein
LIKLALAANELVQLTDALVKKVKIKKGLRDICISSLFDCELCCEVYVICYLIWSAIYRFAPHK